MVCDYEGDLVAEVSRSTTSAEQVIKQPFQLIKVSDNGDDTEAGLLAGAEFTAYLKSWNILYAVMIPLWHFRILELSVTDASE